jgi:hypothetical protein
MEELLRKLGSRLPESSTPLILLGLLVTGISNEIRIHLEAKIARQSELSNAVEKYERLTSLYTLASVEDRTAIYEIQVGGGTDLEKLLKALPIVQRNNTEISIALGGLLELCEHVERVDPERKEIEAIEGVSLRLELPYKVVTKELKENQGAIPTDPAKLADLTTMTNSYYKAYRKVSTEYPELESQVKPSPALKVSWRVSPANQL